MGMLLVLLPEEEETIVSVRRRRLLEPPLGVDHAKRLLSCHGTTMLFIVIDK